MDFKKFNNLVDLDGLKKDVAEAAENTLDDGEVPNQKNRLIFLNQLVNQGFQIHIMKEFLETMDSGCEIAFEDYEQFGNLLMDVFEASSNTGFVLDYSENKKGYKAYKIEEVFDL